MLNIQEKACELRSKGCTNKEGYLMKKASIRKSALKIVAVLVVLVAGAYSCD